MWKGERDGVKTWTLIVLTIDLDGGIRWSNIKSKGKGARGG